jgi:hypothetical protein
VLSDLVRNDVLGMLHQMYVEMKVPVEQQLSLSDLQLSNPDLVTRMIQQAKINADMLLNSRNRPNQQQYQQQQPQQRINNNQQSFDSQSGGGGNQFHQSSNVNNRQSSQNQNQNLGKRQFPDNNNNNSRFNQPAAAPRQQFNQPARQHQQSFQQSGGSRFNSRDEHFQSQQQNINRNTGSSSRQDNYPSNSDHSSKQADTFGRDLPQPAVAAFSPQDRLYVNGFICETPVVIDADRAQSLSSQLACNYRETDPVMSQAFVSVARRVTRRMDMYLADIFSPPQLPQILFGVYLLLFIESFPNYLSIVYNFPGPLPLEPVLRPSESGARSGVSGGDKATERPKMAVPPFRWILSLFCD